VEQLVCSWVTATEDNEEQLVCSWVTATEDCTVKACGPEMVMGSHNIQLSYANAILNCSDIAFVCEQKLKPMKTFYLKADEEI